MKRMRKLILSAALVLFLGLSVVPASAAVPSYSTQYSWRPYSYHYSPAAYYGYKAVNKTTKAANPASSKNNTPAQASVSTNKPANSAAVSAEEQQMVNLVNQERTKKGLSALTIDSRLVKVARMKSQDMIDRKYFAHQSPTYGSPFDMMKAQGISYRYAGENLAGAPTVQQAHTNLMNSEGHRANILNPNYTKIGIGVVKGGPYGLMISQEFNG